MMTTINFIGRRKGVALVVVMAFCIAMLGLITVLVFNTRSQRGSQTDQYDVSRSLMAATAAVQLAIYKYRVLPSEYYKIHKFEMAVRKGAGDAAALSALKTSWMADFQSDTQNSPAEKIKTELDNSTGISHSFGVEEFSLVSKSGSGYTRDYLKIRAWGSANGTRKVLEELIEVRISK
ncbi:MAG: hypothetical protein PHD82_05375 [Candidatus Riflebacteria bacterium]|jgi:hypothetical protein|nr:hypothetical protein [Candidatus Riflebacteria bacterium]